MSRTQNSHILLQHIDVVQDNVRVQYQVVRERIQTALRLWLLRQHFVTGFVVANLTEFRATVDVIA